MVIVKTHLIVISICVPSLQFTDLTVTRKIKAEKGEERIMVQLDMFIFSTGTYHM